MKRELFLHFAFWLSFFIFVALVKHYFNFGSWLFWVGGIVGTLLPDLDHVIYFYFISPTDLSAQRFNFLAQRREVKRMVTLLYETRAERKGLIFHTIFFQLIFFILTFWMMSSSGSIFGKGLVLAFALHLNIDQLIDLSDLGSLDNWFRYLPFKFDLRQTEIYWLGSTLLTLIFGFLF